MRILIIGGTGNISTSTTQALVARGDEVVLYNRGRSGASLPADVTTLVGDRYDHAAFEAQVAGAGPFDCVIDMIGYHPKDVHSLVRAFAGRVAQVIFCSTVDVYTKPAVRYPIAEDAERKASPEFSYAYDKVLCENALLEAEARGDFALTIIRPAQTYNDSQSPLPLIGPGLGWLRRVREGQPIIVLGDGTSFWGAAHRDDVGPTFAAAAGNPAAFGKAYNVTAEEVLTWEQMYQVVAEVMDAPPIDFVRIPTDLLYRMAPKAAAWCKVNFRYNNIFDNSAARADLDYRYTIPWLEGVRRMVAWHDSRGEIDAAEGSPLYDRLVTAWRELGDRAVEALAGAED